MILYLKAHTNLTDLFIDFIKVQLANGRKVSLNWDESDINCSDGKVVACYKGIDFDEEYANGKMDDLQHMKAIHVELYSESNENPVFHIDEILFGNVGAELLYQGSLYTMNWEDSRLVPAMESHKIISVNCLNTETLTFADLYPRNRVCGPRISGTGQNRTVETRYGIKTNVGNLEISEWRILVRQIIERSGEQVLYSQLLQWITEKTTGVLSNVECEEEALDLHSMRMFDNLEWADYLPFNHKYRPEILWK